MSDPSTIFQRTHSGREEIQQKSHGLTQSERLVLIMVDGVSSYKDIRAKLPVLTDERFARALQKLEAKELVVEVFMPLEGQAADELERTVIDRFLQQDPMDPVTIILRDPEDELGMLSHEMLSRPDIQASSFAAPVPSIQSADSVPTALASTAAVVDDPPVLTDAMSPYHGLPRPGSVLDAEDMQAADALTEELRVRKAQKIASSVTPPTMLNPEMAISQPYEELNPLKAVHWGYWLIVSGLSFILGFVLARIT